MISTPPFNVPAPIVTRLNSLLGVSARPHVAAYSERPTVATGCPQWDLEVSFEPRSETQEIDSMLERIRTLVADRPVLAYKSISSWWSIRASVSSSIVLCPTTDQFDMLRFEFGDKAGVSTSADYYIEKLQQIDSQYGINLTGAGYQTIEFVLTHIPTGHAAR